MLTARPALGATAPVTERAHVRPRRRLQIAVERAAPRCHDEGVKSRALGLVIATMVLTVTLGACGSSASEDVLATGEPSTDGGLFGDGRTSGDSAGIQTCNANADCASQQCNLDTHTCGCGGQSVGGEVVPPNLLVVLDRSCSMTDGIGGGKTKWMAAVAALESLTTKYAGKLRFGLTLFPDTVKPDCAQDVIPVPVAAGNEAKIQSLLTSALTKADPYFPNGPCVTNIDAAMLQAKTEPALGDPTRKSFVALVTDGAQSDCNVGGGDNGTIQAVKDLAASGVHTFVVGFGSGVDAKLLDSCAAAGGEARTGTPHKYFDAADQASLDAALDTIAAATLSCDLKLASAPPNGDPNLVYVFFDDAPPAVARDASHTDGWDYDPARQTVTFYGATCARVKSGAIKKESVVFGCPGAAPPTSIPH